MASEHVIQGYQQVVAALHDPRLVPVPATGGRAYGIEWLRGGVARFCAGQPHARRRELVEGTLARLDPAVLRAAASRAATAEPGADDRLLVVRVLAEALGLADPEEVAAAVATASAAYFGAGGARTVAEADAAVAWLVPRTRAATGSGTGAGDDDEAAAGVIGLLVQAGDATAALVANGRRHPDAATAPVEDVLEATLRHDPPVTAMRRLAAGATDVGGTAVAAGDLVLLDITAAHRDPAAHPDLDAHRDPAADRVLTFGAGPHRCPGAAHARALAAGLLEGGRAGEVPATDGRDPARVVAATVAHVLDVAATWTRWDGRPVPSGDRVYTPHKAIRRTADHLLDHLAELDARLAGEEPEPDRWHASATTTPGDLAPFTAEDLDEARSRLVRLARMWSQRLAALTPEQLDDSPGRGWSFRGLAFHLEGSAYYADAVGRLPREAS